MATHFHEEEDAVAEADCAVIVTDHSSYDWESVASASCMIVDTRNALGGGIRAGGKVFKL